MMSYMSRSVAYMNNMNIKNQNIKKLADQIWLDSIPNPLRENIFKACFNRFVYLLYSERIGSGLNQLEKWGLWTDFFLVFGKNGTVI